MSGRSCPRRGACRPGPAAGSDRSRHGTGCANRHGTGGRPRTAARPAWVAAGSPAARRRHRGLPRRSGRGASGWSRPRRPEGRTPRPDRRRERSQRRRRGCNGSGLPWLFPSSSSPSSSRHREAVERSICEHSLTYRTSTERCQAKCERLFTSGSNGRAGQEAMKQVWTKPYGYGNREIEGFTAGPRMSGGTAPSLGLRAPASAAPDPVLRDLAAASAHEGRRRQWGKVRGLPVQTAPRPVTLPGSRRRLSLPCRRRAIHRPGRLAPCRREAPPSLRFRAPNNPAPSWPGRCSSRSAATRRPTSPCRRRPRRR